MAGAFEVVEGVVELVAMAGLQSQAFLEQGVELVAPAGEQVVILVELGAAGGVQGRRGRIRAQFPRGLRGGGRGEVGGKRIGHA